MTKNNHSSGTQNWSAGAFTIYHTICSNISQHLWK